MRILIVSPSYKPAYVYGGPAVSVSELAEALSAIGHSVTVYTTTANGKEELDVSVGKPVMVNGVTVYYFKRQTGDHTHISIGLWKKLASTASSFDIINLQSWWSILIIGAAAICRSKKCKYILSPRGMLSAYSFQKQNSLPKKIIHRTVGHGLLKASYLHATSELEWADCLLINQSWQGFVLPNLIRFPEAGDTNNLSKKSTDQIVFGFLSRIDHKKGLELLFEALSAVNFDYRLKIAGTGEEEYISSLKQLAADLNITSRIDWCGWKSGNEKFQFLKSVDVFVLTSHNENFANVVIESLSVGTPVLLSEGVGLSDYVRKNNMGWICKTNVISITAVLHQLFAERDKLGTIQKIASDAIHKDFDKITLAHKYASAYEKFI